MSKIEFINKIFSDMKSQLAASCSGIICSVSGGMDSMVLLKIMDLFCKENSVPLHAIHVNYQLRKEESQKEQECVENFCRENNISLTVFQSPGLNKKSSLQEQARKVRYSLIEQTAKIISFSVIATGHHMQDQSETLIYRLIRGSGLEGLKGMSVWGKYNEDLFLYRPLLNLSKKNILSIQQHYEIPYCIDSSNLLTDYTRNKIRLNILPFFEEINPEFNRHIYETSLQIKDTFTFIRKISESKLTSDLILSQTENQIELLFDSLFQEDQVIITDILRILIKRISPSTTISSTNLHEIHFLMENSSSWTYHCANNVTLHRGSQSLFLLSEQYPTPLSQNLGFSEVKGEWGCFFYELSHKELSSENSEIQISEDDFPLEISSRKTGDKIFIPGVGNKKIKKIFLEKKIPQFFRNQIPLIRNKKQEIIFFPGVNIKRKSLPQKKTLVFSLKVLQKRFIPACLNFLEPCIL